MNKLSHICFAALTAALVSTTVSAETVTIGIRSEPSSIDPYFHNLGPNNAMLGQIFGRLVDWTPGMDQMIPRLARSWRALDDTTWEFKLRKGIKFHDGSDFTADDVIFSVKRADGYTGGNSSFRTYTKGSRSRKLTTIRFTSAPKHPIP